MSDEELGKRFRQLVRNKGRSPEYHDAVINELRTKWSLMYELIQKARTR